MKTPPWTSPPKTMPSQAQVFRIVAMALWEHQEQRTLTRRI